MKFIYANQVHEHNELGMNLQQAQVHACKPHCVWLCGLHELYELVLQPECDVVNLFETTQLSYFFHFYQLFFKIIRTAIVQV